MADKRAGYDFAASADQREFEIFMLRDKAREEFQAMRDKAEKEIEQLRQQQEARREEDIRKVKQELTMRHPTPQLTPSWGRRWKPLKAQDLQVLTEQTVEARNDKAASGLQHLHREGADDFLAKQKEARLCREAFERADRRENRKQIDIDRDLDRER